MTRILDTAHTVLPTVQPTVQTTVQTTVETERASVPPPSSPTDPPARRRVKAGVAIGVASVLVLVVVTALGWWSVRLADRVEAVDYDTAVALEGGVRPLVSDRVGELGNVTAVTVKRTPDPDPGRVHLLAPAGEWRPRVSVVSGPDPADPLIDGWLADGRPYEIRRSEGRYVSIFTVGTDGQYVSVLGREIAFDELLDIAAEVEVRSTALDRLPDGWVELAAVSMPTWRQGFGTYYDFEGGRQLAINVEWATPGREPLVTFANTEPVDLGTGSWAYRYLPPSDGIVFELDDVVVDLKGDFSEAELVIVAHTLREMLPSEHPIVNPDVHE